LRDLSKQRSVRPPWAQWLLRYAAPAAVVCLGVGLSVGAFALARRAENQRTHDRFAAAAQDRIGAIREQLAAHSLVLEALRGLYLASDNVERREFRTFTAPLLARHTDIHALAWILRVPDANRDAYEAQVRSEGIEDFGIVQRAGPGRMVPASRREEYFPVTFLESGKARPAALGFDLASDSIRLEALNRSRDSGEPVATATLTLVQATANDLGFLTFLPVYDKGTAPDSTEQRREHLRGFVQGVFRTGKLVEDALEDLVPAGIDLALYDSADAPADHPTYYHYARAGVRRAGEPRHAEVPQAGEFSLRATIDLPGRQWLVVAAATPLFLAEHTTNYLWGVLVGGLAFTLLAGGYLLSATEHAARQTRLAGELSQINEALTAEMIDRSQTEESLHKSEERFRAIFEASTDCILVWDRQYNNLYANQAAIDHVGTTREKVIGHNIRDGLGHLPEFMRLWLGRLDQVFASGRPMRVEDHSLVGPREVWSESSLLPIRDGMGDVFAVGVVYRDITARKKDEQALRQSEERYRSVVDNVGIGVSLISPRMEILALNRQMKTWYPELDVSVKPLCYRAYNNPPREGVCSYCPTRRTLEDGLVHEAVTQTPSGGSTRNFRIVSSPIRDAEGHISAAVEMVEDITERLRAEEALRKSEERFKNLVESVTDYIYTVQVEGSRATKAVHGPGCVAVTGYAPEEYEKDPDAWSRIVPQEDRPAVQAQTQKLTAGRPCAPLEHRIIRKDGVVRWVRNTPVLVHDEQGRFAGYEGLVQDITDQRKMQEQLLQAQKMEAVGQLAGGVAHDFRNQLTIVRGFAEMLLRRSMVSEGGREHVEEILKAVDRSAILSNELLAFSRKQVLRPEVLRVDDLIAGMGKTLIRMIGEDIRLSVVPAAGDSSVRVDPGQLQQALINLVLNARDAMPKGGQLTIETAKVELDPAYALQHPGTETGPHVLLAVSDTGTGMDRQTASKIFEPFFTTKPVGKGTGLGLSMVYGFVRQSGGTVSVYSEPGLGTTFKIYLPASGASDEPAPAGAETPELPRGSGTVLVVEDEEPIRKIMVETLTECGYEVREAANAKEALARIGEARGRIDLLVTDVVMPGMDGSDLARQARATDPTMRVLYVSGYTGKALFQHGIGGSGVPLLVKPFGSQALIEAVMKALEKTT
jgi:two-component system, cell cycle sensor histidine kinase and response regulator CckA